jgi:hypothetical protein
MCWFCCADSLVLTYNTRALMNYVIFQYMSQDSIVGIATCYGLNSWGFELQGQGRFPAPEQTGPGAHPTSCTRGTQSLSLGVKWPGSGTDHPHPYSASNGILKGDLYLYYFSMIFYILYSKNWTWRLAMKEKYKRESVEFHIPQHLRNISTTHVQLPECPTGLHYHEHPGWLYFAADQLKPHMQLPEHLTGLHFHELPGWLCFAVEQLNHQVHLRDHPNGLHYNGYPGSLCSAAGWLNPHVQFPEHPTALHSHVHSGWLCFAVEQLNHQVHLWDQPNGLHHDGYPGSLCSAVGTQVQFSEHPTELCSHEQPGWQYSPVGHLNHLLWGSYLLPSGKNLNLNPNI